MSFSLKSLMEQATQLTRAGKLAEATAAIQRALRGAAGVAEQRGAPPHEGRVFDMEAPAPDPASAPPAPRGIPATIRSGAGSGAAPVNVGSAVPLGGVAAGAAGAAPTAAPTAASAPQARNDEVADRGLPGRAPTDDPGRFIAGSHTHGRLTRPYKLYVPPGHAGRALPLVVLLHGCTQDPDDFAAGTGMNQRAREQGFFVLYPQQTRQGNATQCWNWFAREHQQRGAGEPGLIADLTGAVLREYAIDPARVYIAGLSAGGAMAAIVADAYPELYAAAGVHSGLPRGAAGSVMGAFAAMRDGGAAPAPGPAGPGVPTIVFHGDQDRTVHPRNGERVIAIAVGGAGGGSGPAAQVTRGTAAQGRGYTRSVHGGADGRAHAEHWLVHGMAHAWSGGAPAGSYTDAGGPDASGEMLRFFFAHPHPAPGGA